MFGCLWHQLSLPTTQGIGLTLAYASGIMSVTEYIPSVVQVMFQLPLMIAFNGIGMSCALHRLLSHRAFSTSSVGLVLFALIGCLTNQGPILWWASIHRRHHADSDGPSDPHSWSQSGFWYAYVGWLHYEYETQWSFVLPLYRTSPTLRLLNQTQPLLLGTWILSWWYLVGLRNVLWWYWIPSILGSLVGSLYANVSFHRPNTTNPRVHCNARDRPSLRWNGKLNTAAMIGEGSHGDHHRHPRRAHRTSDTCDLPYQMLLRPLAALGCIWDLH